MQQEEKELRLNQLKLIVIVMTLIFAFMLVYTVYFLIDYRDKYGFFEKITAEIIEHQEIDGKEYDLLSYKIDGNEFRITTEYESKNEVGDTITIYYDTNNPLGVVYALDSRRIWMPVLTTIFALTNVGLIVIYILIKRGIVGNKNSQKIEAVNNESIKEAKPEILEKITKKENASVVKPNQSKIIKEKNKNGEIKEKASKEKLDTKNYVNKTTQGSKSKSANKKK